MRSSLLPWRPAGVKVLQLNGPAAGQTVPQLHTHLLPCYSAVTHGSGSAAPSSAAPSGPPSSTSLQGNGTQAAAPEAQPAVAAPAEAAGAPQGGGTAEAGQAPEGRGGPPGQAGGGAAAALRDEEAGPLTAALRNRLPTQYAPGDPALGYEWRALQPSVDAVARPWRSGKVQWRVLQPCANAVAGSRR